MRGKKRVLRSDTAADASRLLNSFTPIEHLARVQDLSARHTAPGYFCEVLSDTSNVHSPQGLVHRRCNILRRRCNRKRAGETDRTGKEREAYG